MSITDHLRSIARTATQPELAMALSTALIVAGHHLARGGAPAPVDAYAPKSAA
ncbi:hypothetical protein [Mycobacterium sp. M26]|uniref:hypothetical protein n=1 Tax=Mycobacterium sp. M26 TaxID=1762962 RepID=UPI000A90B3EE|nr:hypothetical protein [Mycobacterium sp. M26]